MGGRLIYLVRHGETEKGSEKKYFIGQSDVDLSPLGIQQAKELAQRLKDIPLNHIYCSNLKRTIKTAEAIGALHGIKPVCSEKFAEINMGIWDGLSFEEVKSRYPLEYEERGKNISHYRVPGGESFFDFSQRVTQAFYEVVNYTDGNLLIVAHAGVNRAILCDILEIPLKNLFRISQNYGCINILSYNRKTFKVKQING
ncbi:MAG TPA: alpha-ribazole phosphatase [Clostridiales bacterium]|nr:alpha-ribazole phosphatase [Clostridiales bacterium]